MNENQQVAAGGIDARSLASHLTELADETSTLFRKELELARAEMNEKVQDLKKGVTWIGTSGAVLYAGALLVLGAIALFVAQFIPLWLSAFLVGGVTLGAGYAMFARGKSDVQGKNLVPHRTVRSVREAKNLAVEQPA